jgi:uncharacterized protein (DUF1697 family)
LSATTGCSQLPTFITLQTGNFLLESEDEEEEVIAAASAASLMDSFHSLPPRSKASVAQHKMIE